MRRTVAAVLFALFAAAPAVAVNTIQCWKVIFSRPCVEFIVGDVEAELPTSGVPEGVSAWAKDTDRLVCFYSGSWQPCNDGGGAGVTDGDKGDITVSASGATWLVDADAIALGTDTTGSYVSSVTASQGVLLTGTEGASIGLIDCAATEVLKRNAGDTAWECAADASGGGDPTLAGDVDGLGSANDLDEAAVEAELEGVLDIQDLQGAAIDGQIPNTITIDLATQATTALAGDSAAAFFSSGMLEDVLIDGSAEADEVNPTLGSQTQGTYVASVTANQGLLLTGTEGAALGLIDCAATELLKRNAGDTAWECAADVSGGGDPTLAGDVDGLGSANDLDEAAVEVELEAVLDLSDLQGSVADSQVPNSVTVDLAALATTANAGDSATAFFPAGTIEAARIPAVTALASACTNAQVLGGNAAGTGVECQADAGAPSTVDYLVRTADAGLSAERTVMDTTTVNWDWSTAGQVRAVAISALDLTCTNCIGPTEIATLILNDDTDGDYVSGATANGGLLGTATIDEAETLGLKTCANDQVLLYASGLWDCSNTVDAGDSATNFFASGTIEAARLPFPLKGILLGSKLSANFNSTADQAITITAGTNWIIEEIVVKNASISLTTAAGGFYTAASKGGFAWVPASQVYSALNTTAKYMRPSLSAGALSGVSSIATLYFSLTTAQGSTATADIYVFGTRFN